MNMWCSKPQFSPIFSQRGAIAPFCLTSKLKYVILKKIKGCVDMVDLKPSWKFSDVQDNIEAIKSQYEGVLSSFLCYEIKERTRAIHEIKQQVFQYENIQYWQRERLWEAMNGDFEIEEFRRLCK